MDINWWVGQLMLAYEQNCLTIHELKFWVEHQIIMYGSFNVEHYSESNGDHSIHVLLYICSIYNLYILSDNLTNVQYVFSVG